MRALKRTPEGNWDLADGSYAYKHRGGYTVYFPFPSVEPKDQLEFDTFIDLAEYAKKVLEAEEKRDTNKPPEAICDYCGKPYVDDKPDPYDSCYSFVCPDCQKKEAKVD